MCLAPPDVSAVVCTLNSIGGIARCLTSLRDAGVGELLVVDASSTDGTAEVAERLADHVLVDPGRGLGMARNIGIASTTGALVLNMGSDNVMPPDQLQRMIDTLERLDVQGVSARTRIEGDDYLARGLNAWRTGRFVPGEAAVIGTPTLLDGDLLRAHPYDPARRFSDDSELCERWSSQLGARFAVSDAFVLEVGKTSWDEVVARCRMYGTSDAEVFAAGRRSGWSPARQARSLMHPARVDFFHPVGRLSAREALEAAPFLAAFTVMRYGFWAAASRRG
ncbi:MAG: glycosyltransferase family 2 protein [Candidatus Nanopelagicales bacterium]